MEQVTLTAKQQAFVDAYIGEAKGNATKAAHLAGYSGNYNTVAQTGDQNLKNPKIVTAIRNRSQKVLAKNEKRIIDTHDEFAKNLEFVGKLRDAATKWLVDPEDDNLFTIDPRADEIDVVYYDGITPKRSTLAELLARVDGIAYSATPFVKTVDLREYALKVVDRIENQSDKIAKIKGDYTDSKENPETAAKRAQDVAYTARHERLRALRDAEIHAITSKCEHCGPHNLGAPLDEAEYERLLDGLSSRYKVDKAAVRLAVENEIQALGNVG